MENNKIEKRQNNELIFVENNITGYAAVFDKMSQKMSEFYEIILQGAFDNIIEKSDVFATLNHDNSRGILARSKYGEGTLKLVVDSTGLQYTFELPDTALGNELKSYLLRGEIDSSSFAFTVEDEEWVKGSDGIYVRYIKKIAQLFDVSPVFSPAYLDTTVALRNLRAIQQRNIAANDKELSEYYEKYNKYLK